MEDADVQDPQPGGLCFTSGKKLIFHDTNDVIIYMHMKPILKTQQLCRHDNFVTVTSTNTRFKFTKYLNYCSFDPGYGSGEKTLYLNGCSIDFRILHRNNIHQIQLCLQKYKPIKTYQQEYNLSFPL